MQKQSELTKKNQIIKNKQKSIKYGWKSTVFTLEKMMKMYFFTSEKKVSKSETFSGCTCFCTVLPSLKMHMQQTKITHIHKS